MMRPQAMALLFAVASAYPSLTHHDNDEYPFMHDEIEQHSGGVRDSGYFFSPQLSAIRIQINIVSISALSSPLQTFFTGTLLPAAKEWIESALSVVPISGTLKATRSCAEGFLLGGTCATEGAVPTCGTNADTTSYTIPDSLLDSLETCSSCLTNGVCSGCVPAVPRRSHTPLPPPGCIPCCM